MRIYIVTSGTIFGLVVLAHLLRMGAEGARIAADPWFVLTTIAAAALCGWAFSLVRTSRRS